MSRVVGQIRKVWDIVSPTVRFYRDQSQKYKQKLFLSVCTRYRVNL